MRRELASLFPSDIAILSVGDMAKIKIGAPAVSRYHQIKRLFLGNDTHNLNDHDFSVPDYLLNVSGHMFLENHSDVSIPSHDETLVYGFQNVNDKNHFENMNVEKHNRNIFEIITRQAEYHHNVAMTV